MSRLTIRRESRMAYAARRVRILVDGEEAASLPNGAEAVLTVPSGRHLMEAVIGRRSRGAWELDLTSTPLSSLTIAMEPNGRASAEYLDASGAAIKLHSNLSRRPPLILRWWAILLIWSLTTLGSNHASAVALLVLVMLRLIWSVAGRKKSGNAPSSAPPYPRPVKASNRAKSLKRSTPCLPKTTRPDRPPNYVKELDLCVIDGEEPPLSEFTPGTEIYFQPEPENVHDHTAVRFVNSHGTRGGYLYRSDQKEAVFEALNLGAFLSGTVIHYDQWGMRATLTLWLPERTGYTISPTEYGLGSGILNARQSVGLTQKYTADQLGISVRDLSALEHSRTFYCPTAILEGIARLTGVSLDTIING